MNFAIPFLFQLLIKAISATISSLSSPNVQYTVVLNVGEIKIKPELQAQYAENSAVSVCYHNKEYFQENKKIKLTKLNIHSLEYGCIDVLVKKRNADLKLVGKLFFRECQMSNNNYILVNLHQMDKENPNKRIKVGYIIMWFKIKYNKGVTADDLLKNELSREGLGHMDYDHSLIKPRLSLKMVKNIFENRMTRKLEIPNILVELNDLISLNSRMIKRCDERCTNMSCSIYCKNGYGPLMSKNEKKLLGLIKKILQVKFHPTINKAKVSEAEKNEDILAKGMINSICKFILYKKGNDTAVLAFSGIDNLEELVEVLDLRITWFYNAICQQGIKTLFVSFFDDNWSELTKILKKYKKLIITGHSIGGGVATMLHYYLNQSKSLSQLQIKTVTFGSPPVFYNVKDAKNYTGIKNYVFGSDPIPSLCFGQLLLIKAAIEEIAGKKNASSHDCIFEGNNDEKEFISLLQAIYRTIKKYNFLMLGHLGPIYRIMDFKDVSNQTTLYYSRKSFIPHYLIFLTNDSIQYHFIFSYLQAFSKDPKRTIVSPDLNNQFVFSLSQVINKMVAITENIITK